MITRFFSKKKKSEEKKKTRIKRIFQFLMVILIISLLTFIYNAISNSKYSFNKEKQPYFAESPYCQTSDDCLLYGCTNCGNKFWIDKNISDNQLTCDKKLPMIIQCECQVGQCKRVYK